jgi:electron transport complex protein RnfC
VLRDVQIQPDTILGAGELIIHAAPMDSAAIPGSCIRCGWCADACPTRVHPAGILEAAQLDDPELAERNGLEACIECGICTYVCPSELPLLRGIRTMMGKG